ncbi:unnamed protein product [Pseudo-nitzschia multistriata]|uniref:Uncharacterized protein n=1 Tax=Pseudo-nitzschia multistriata TaxID=183589 RepID=A0A448YVH4_9STRA|nr:unnamed protein product [Pseudo-nitzschia multistriata]
MGQTTSKDDPLESACKSAPDLRSASTAELSQPEARKEDLHSLPAVLGKMLPKVLLLSHPSGSKNHNDDGFSRATESTGQLTPPSPLGSSSSSNLSAAKNHKSHVGHHPIHHHYHNCLDSDTNPNPHAASKATTNANACPHRNLQAEATLLRQRDPDHHHQRSTMAARVHRPDKRSNPVKFRRWQTIGGDHVRPLGYHAHRSCEAAARAFPEASAAAGTDPSAGSKQTPPPDLSYLERMYDSRTWEMYRRITTHREKVEAFHAKNARARREDLKKGNDDRHSAANRTTVSEPALRRVARAQSFASGSPCREPPKGSSPASSVSGSFATTASSAIGEQQHHHHQQQHQQQCIAQQAHPFACGGSSDCHPHSYDHHVDLGNEDDDAHGFGFLHRSTEWRGDDEHNLYDREDHSAPPYHYQHTHYCDSGRRYLQHECPQPSGHYNVNANNENYSEWEHMNGEVEDEEGHVNGESSSDPTIFLFDF